MSDPRQESVGQKALALQCPRCAHELGANLRCGDCGASYPVVDGVPVLIDEFQSVFSHEDVRNMAGGPERSQRIAHRLVPSISSNLVTDRLYQQLRALVLCSPHPTVLCIGNADGGKGFEHFRHPDIRIVSTDVAITHQTDYAVDAHSLPFPDGSFDAVVAQAVLEHVSDPFRCVAEIHRVLRRDGLVFAESPFMQQVHLGRYDFTRFTHLGHRRLFRMFTEIESGQVASAGSALAWSLTYFSTSLMGSARGRRLAYVAGRFFFFWLKYLDRWLRRNPGSWDAASAFYFIGRRAEQPISDREVIAGYRGAGR
ncbi:MAG: methyltransferase domain-containing protein [Actinomycetota bacterium]|nr:methyltransferase domain-containing protein [Actinomycetota bacterium]